MSDQYDALSPDHQRFIEKQKMFFVGTAAADGRVNLSPKGMPSLAVRGPNEILWLNLTGSGNETAAHLQGTNRITLMWCAYEGPPLILRVYGQAEPIYREDAAWVDCEAAIPSSTGARQYFRVAIDLVQTSCGYAVPLYEYKDDRTALTKWAEKKGDSGIKDYWSEKNSISLDGKSTRFADSD